jgi:ARS binding protein 2
VANGPAFESRDGVPLEEDLALRALVPEWKPKRGRKRAEDKENDELKAVKRPHLDTSVGALHNSAFAPHGVNFPQSAIPFSAFPEDLDVDPWGASSFASDGVTDGAADGQADGSLAGPEFWRATSPGGYPHSAIIPRNHHPAEMFSANEPQSAVTPSSRDRSRTRRRHGPAVSSAWPGGHGSTTGKVRGRPPNRVSAPGGPFSSFPVNPGRSTTPLADNVSLRSSPAITVERDANPQPSNLPDQTPSLSQRPSARPGKLQLQVPPHLGRPIRLATPPTVVLNGTNNGPPPFQPESRTRHDSVATSNGMGEAEFTSDVSQNGPPGSVLVSIEDIIRAVSDRLRRGRLSGRPTPLGSEEARALANAAVSRLRLSHERASPEYLSLLCVTCLGVSQKFGLGGSRPGPVTIKASVRSDAMSESGLSKGSSLPTYTLIFESNPAHGVVTNTVFSDISLSLDLAHAQVDRTARCRDSLTDVGDELAFDSDLDEEFFDGTMSQTAWKQRYMQLRKQMRKKELAFQEYRRNILNSVMADI